MGILTAGRKACEVVVGSTTLERRIRLGNGLVINGVLDWSLSGSRGDGVDGNMRPSRPSEPPEVNKDAESFRSASSNTEILFLEIPTTASWISSSRDFFLSQTCSLPPSPPAVSSIMTTASS